MQTWRFLRFTTPERAQALVMDGVLYCNTAEYFRGLDGDTFRGDRNEGLSAVHDPKDVRILLNGVEVPVSHHVKIWWHDQGFANIYCLYGHGPHSLYVDQRMIDAGSACVVIRDTEEFLRRVHAAAGAPGSGVELIATGPVEYIEEGYRGKVTPLHKYREYQYQYEFRIALKTNAKGPFTLRLGSLEDIAFIVDSAEFNDLIRRGNDPDSVK